MGTPTRATTLRGLAAGAAALLLTIAAAPPAPLETDTTTCASGWVHIGDDDDGKTRKCIADLTAQIDQASGPVKAKLLSQRAQLHIGLSEPNPAFADYSAALGLTPDDQGIRLRRAGLALQLNRGDDALSDAEKLLAQSPRRVQYQLQKGHALSLLKRHQQAITVYSNAIALTQSCAEASILQHKVNELRSAFETPPTKEEALKGFETRTTFNDVPEPAMASLGFHCAPTEINSLDDLVVMKSALYQSRGNSYRALGDTAAARRDYRYALALSPTPELESLNVCDLEVELKDHYAATEDCRRAFDLNMSAILATPVRAAKIGTFLLEDGDLKGACRIAFPFIPPDSATQSYMSHADIKALQTRVDAALNAAKIKRCDTP